MRLFICLSTLILIFQITFATISPSLSLPLQALLKNYLIVLFSTPTKSEQLKIYLAKTDIEAETASAIKLSSIKFRFMFAVRFFGKMRVGGRRRGGSGEGEIAAINVCFSESTKQVIKSNGKISSFWITNGVVYGVARTKVEVGRNCTRIWSKQYFLYCSSSSFHLHIVKCQVFKETTERIWNLVPQHGFVSRSLNKEKWT